MQTPKKGVPRAMTSLTTATRWRFSRLSMVSAAAPTPGRITPAAARMVSGSSVTTGCKPTCSAAWVTLRRLPAP